LLLMLMVHAQKLGWWSAGFQAQLNVYKQRNKTDETILNSSRMTDRQRDRQRDTERLTSRQTGMCTFTSAVNTCNVALLTFTLKTTVNVDTLTTTTHVVLQTLIRVYTHTHRHTYSSLWQCTAQTTIHNNTDTKQY